MVTYPVHLITIDFDNVNKGWGTLGSKETKETKRNRKLKKFIPLSRLKFHETEGKPQNNNADNADNVGWNEAINIPHTLFINDLYMSRAKAKVDGRWRAASAQATMYTLFANSLKESLNLNWGSHSAVKKLRKKSMLWKRDDGHQDWRMPWIGASTHEKPTIDNGALSEGPALA